ncbi:MAG: hypothetical protein EXR70_00380 [Deltaproteobacteria bacterium]|nr:hypothetical protein [Deltaproteobacteria bacterium]
MDSRLSCRHLQRTVAMVLLTVLAVWFASVAAARAQQKSNVSVASTAPAQSDNGAKAEAQPGQPSGVLHPLDFQRVQWAYHSLYITAIGVVGCILALFICLYFGKDVKNRFEPFFGDGQVTQLVVIIAVTGNVCSLAIAGILSASEVSAIYGGIIGYVLGRGKKSGDSDRGSSANGKHAPDAASHQP